MTVANKRPTQPYYCFDEFFKSLQGEEITILGSTPGEYGGLGSKPRLLYSAIKSGEIKEKYLIFCDCFDLVFATKPVELFEHFLKFNVPVVVSAEKNCFPADLKDEYDKLDNFGSPYRYLNSGMIVGETDAVLACLEEMDAKNIPNDYWSAEQNCMINPNDQFEWMKIFLKQPVKIELDYGQLLCNTLHSVKLEDLEFDEFGIMNKECGCYPMSFHMNGSAKTDGLRKPILKHLKLI